MNKESPRNLIVFFAIAVVLMGIYQVFVFGPMQKRAQAEQQARRAAATQVQTPANAAPGAAVFKTREQITATTPRVPIDTPALKGSIALTGGRIDDLFLKQYPETLDKNSPPV